jgi:hypothetical protein
MFLFQAGGLEESAVTGIVVGALLGAGLLMAFYFFRYGPFMELKFTLLLLPLSPVFAIMFPVICPHPSFKQEGWWLNYQNCSLTPSWVW